MAMSISVLKFFRKVASLLCVFVLMKSVVESKFPLERDATSMIKDVKCVGVILNKKASTKCQGTFLTQKHLATSCRCIGTTNKDTGVFTRGTANSYEVKSWSTAPEETRSVAKLYFHYNCGIEPFKVIMDLGLVEASSGFSTSAVEPANLPNARLFRFYSYIYRVQTLETRCLTTNLDSSPGSMVNAHVKPNDHERCFRSDCHFEDPKYCEFLVLRTNHICAVPDKPETSSSPNCTTYASAGAPLLCHKLLVGINSRTDDCTVLFDRRLFIRIDFAMEWLNSQICS